LQNEYTSILIFTEYLFVTDQETTLPSPQSNTPLGLFHDAVRQWFAASFAAPTRAQQLSWPAIQSRQNTLLLAPTGSGKTLAAFLSAIDRLMFGESPNTTRNEATTPRPIGVKLIYISPLKALGNDVERNLRAPLAGVRAAAERLGHPYHLPQVGVRSGDTPPDERRRMTRQPPDILITTPESLYLMLTSRARDILLTVDTVIIDEIHSVAKTKRGSHLFASLERLEFLRRQSHGSDTAPMQRIGLSATQRPLDEIATLLGGATSEADESVAPIRRPVQIIEAGHGKSMDLTIEVPVEDMADLSNSPSPDHAAPATNPAADIATPSIWPAIHPRLVQLIRAHRSTMVFVNSRRLAERMATAINELAGEELAMAHHGSIAKETRSQIEDRLKLGKLPAIIATSSLELGIDMGAVDLVVQIEAPPSIASGIQRIGRAGHQVGGVSRGIIFPKFRGDLLACSAAAPRMQEGQVEATYFPRNPLDVLAQQIVAMVALEPIHIDEVFATMRSAAPFTDLSRSLFEGVVDLMSGRYPSSEFSELRPRVNWDRISGEISPRRGTQRLAIANGGTIPDRGLYGVFLADGMNEKTTRVGELDEEMVFETNPGDVFLLGASAWKVVEITHDRVLVVPAPGEPGRMPFWRGDAVGRPLEFGKAIGELTRELLQTTPEQATQRLIEHHRLDDRAAHNLVTYIQDQQTATGEAPSDKTLVIESFLDEIGDWRVAILSPFGARVHAPWATAVAARLRQDDLGEVDMMWNDDGIVFRLPGSAAPPPMELFFPESDTIEAIVVRELGTTALFASRFRENAARALLLPRRQPGRRTPLWLQRRKSADLLAVAAKYERFPIMLETFRECLRDVFDLPGLQSILSEIEQRSIRIHPVETQVPSPFASSLMFMYTANFLYNGDTPLAERRAAALSLDLTQLRELLGDAELRELLDLDVVEEIADELQWLQRSYPLKDADGVHDLLRQLGDLTTSELHARSGLAGHGSSTAVGAHLDSWIVQLRNDRRIIEVNVAGEQRFIIAEDASLYRDALGAAPPPGLPEAFLEITADPWEQILRRYARTHAPFTPLEVAQRFGVGEATVQPILRKLTADGRLLEGEFLPGGRQREWCDANVLKKIKRRSLARLREQVEPVPSTRFAEFLTEWHELHRPRRGLDGLLDAIEQVQGYALPFSDLQQRILPSRVADFRPGDLDELCAAGEVVWRGHQTLGASDGYVQLYLADAAPVLARPPEPINEQHTLDLEVVHILQTHGALFFDALLEKTAGFQQDLADALWRLVWTGYVTNDTLAPLRGLANRRSNAKRRRSSGRRPAFRSRRTGRVAGAEGRWSLFKYEQTVTSTQRQTAIAKQLLERYGVVTREIVRAEGIVGGFAGLYPVLKAMEETGRIRRGYFVEGQGGAQFATPAAVDRLRCEPTTADAAHPPGLTLATTDPANPYGGAIPWPTASDKQSRSSRSAGTAVIMRQGHLFAYLSKDGTHVTTYWPVEQHPDGVQSIIDTFSGTSAHGDPCYLSKVNGVAVRDSGIAKELLDAGFISYSQGFLRRQDQADSRSAVRRRPR
jgi:ATP-dependent Lhr-like helicase